MFIQSESGKSIIPITSIMRIEVIGPKELKLTLVDGKEINCNGLTKEALLQKWNEAPNLNIQPFVEAFIKIQDKVLSLETDIVNYRNTLDDFIKDHENRMGKLHHKYNEQLLQLKHSNKELEEFINA